MCLRISIPQSNEEETLGVDETNTNDFDEDKPIRKICGAGKLQNVIDDDNDDLPSFYIHNEELEELKADAKLKEAQIVIAKKEFKKVYFQKKATKEKLETIKMKLEIDEIEEARLMKQKKLKELKMQMKND
uniref:Uncharacterized protein n=1 Tax=Panagrolaimus sp. ES5 TaxID=591445 RepID=A0AC34GAC5_9BILA